MSREVIIRIRDDLDGSDAEQSIEFSYRGTSYEIDLSSHNAELFDKSVQQFLDVARKVVPVKSAAGTGGAASRPPTSRAVIQQRRDIRAWANENGFTVDARGMIASTVIDAYVEANPAVTLLPETRNRYHRSTAAAAAVTPVSAQQAESGLLPLSALMSDPHAHRDRRGERSGKRQREAIRAWAVENGLDQSPVGQIKQAVRDAYNAAHPNEEGQK